MKKADLHYYVTSYFRSYLPGQNNLGSNTVSGYADAFRLLFKFCEEKKGLRVDQLKISDYDSEVVCEAVYIPRRNYPSSNARKVTSS